MMLCERARWTEVPTPTKATLKGAATTSTTLCHSDASPLELVARHTISICFPMYGRSALGGITMMRWIDCSWVMLRVSRMSGGLARNSHSTAVTILDPSQSSVSAVALNNVCLDAIKVSCVNPLRMIGFSAVTFWMTFVWLLESPRMFVMRSVTASGVLIGMFWTKGWVRTINRVAVS